MMWQLASNITLANNFGPSQSNGIPLCIVKISHLKYVNPVIIESFIEIRCLRTWLLVSLRDSKLWFSFPLVSAINFTDVQFRCSCSKRPREKVG